MVGDTVGLTLGLFVSSSWLFCRELSFVVGNVNMDLAIVSFNAFTLKLFS